MTSPVETEALPDTTLHSELSLCLSQAKASVARPIARWVEEEIVLPTGPFANERYRHHRHPASKLWFEQLDSGRWSRFATTAPGQNGKTLMCYSLPILWHLLEIGETAIIGLPSMDMANDKWMLDLKPIIEASRYASLLPAKGEGSRDGQVKRSIVFRNGAMLRFMTGGGQDKKRAGFTSRVLGITETDGMDEPGQASREADKIEQLEARTRAFGATGKRVYLECTVSVEKGRIWQEMKGGSDSRIVRPCPHCGAWVAPEREHLLGWQSAESEIEAGEKAHFVCPECAHPWSEEDRWSVAKDVRLVHRGQEITPDGKIVGEPPPTRTLGFRWSAIDNPFATMADLGADEWRARRDKNRENTEKKMRQFVWAVPYEPPDIELTPLDADQVRERKGQLQRREVPDRCLGIAVQVDTGKRRLHWEARALVEDGSQRTIEYGIQPVDADRLGVHRGLVEALKALRTYLENGWPTSSGEKLRPAQVWIDAAWHEHTDAVYAFCAEANAELPEGQERYRPTHGYGEDQREGPYRAPAGRSHDVLYVGKQFHIARVRRDGRLLPGVLLVHVNSDHWKSEFHQRLRMPADEPGCLTLFGSPDPFEHSEYAAHAVAEHQVAKWKPGRGEIVKWERISRENHFLDTGYGATAACQFILDERQRQATDSEAAQKTAGGWFAAQGNRKSRTRRG